MLPESATVYRHKRYFSKDRNSVITIDVSIEIVLPGASTWSILWAWECKDYERSVDVGEVEEFYSQLLQIGGANIKGGFASAGPLRRTALEYARSKGIAVVRIRPETEMEWVLYYRVGERYPRSFEEIWEDEITSLSKKSQGGTVHGVSSKRRLQGTQVTFVEEEIDDGINGIPHQQCTPLIDDAAWLERVAKWLGARPWRLNESPICCSYVEKVLGLPENSAGLLIPRAAARFQLFLERYDGDIVILIRKQ